MNRFPVERIAVLLPCRNEEAAIASVVAAFRAALPEAVVYVYDNGSSDRTAERAAAAGAVVRRHAVPGKGNVVRRMFADVEADAYLMCDGDLTYEVAQAPALLRLLCEDRLDMVVGARCPDPAFWKTYRFGHGIGNRLLTGTVRQLFSAEFHDMLSGYRVFSRRFVKSFPAESSGFEIETELTVHTLALRLPWMELPTAYSNRPAGSASKLRTWRDGTRILLTIGRLYRDHRPFCFFCILALVCQLVAVAAAAPVVSEYLRSGLVPRLPTFVLAVGAQVLAGLFFGSGIILQAVAAGRIEARRLAYLRI